jgi:hypothetical protein
MLQFTKFSEASQSNRIEPCPSCTRRPWYQVNHVTNKPQNLKLRSCNFIDYETLKILFRLEEFLFLSELSVLHPVESQENLISKSDRSLIKTQTRLGWLKNVLDLNWSAAWVESMDICLEWCPSHACGVLITRKRGHNVFVRFMSRFWSPLMSRA